MRYGERWRGARRAFHQHFRSDATVEHLPKVQRWAKEFARRLMDEPEAFMEHIT